MASDPNIYAQVGQGVTQPLNALTSLGQVAQTGNALMGLQRAQSQKAAGQAFQASINPDGTTNQAALMQNLAANPNAAMAAQESAQAGQTLSAAEYSQHMARLNYGASGAAALLSANGGPTLQAVKQYYDNAVADGHVTPQDEAQIMAGFTNDPGQNALLIKQRLQQNVAAQTALTNNLATPGVSDVGNLLQPTLTGPIAGAAPPTTVPVGQGIGKGIAPTIVSTGGALQPMVNGQPAGPATPLTPSPDSRNANVSTFNPVTRTFSYTRNSNVSPMVDGAGNPLPSTGQPNYGLPPSGRVTPSSMPTPAGQPSSNPPVQTTPANQAQPALGAGDEAAGSVAHAVAARGDANTYQQRIYPLQAAETALSGADTGAGSETLNGVRALVQNVTPGFLQAALPGYLTDPAKVAAYQEANKYLQQVANNSPGASGSDARQASASAANASVHISPLAAQAVVRGAIGQQRMTQAGTLAFNQSGLPAAGYDQFMNQWNTQQDPRGYIADKLSSGDRAQLVQSLGGVGSPAYKRFKASYQQGLSTGVVAGNGG